MVIKAKILIYKILFTPFTFLELLNFLMFTIINKKIVIFDLDNTLVDTVALLKRKVSMHIAWQKASVINEVREVLNSYIRQDYKVVILSSRPYNTKHLSKMWILENKINVDMIIHTSSTSSKEIFYFISPRKLVVYDDLSYNSENGETLFFEKQIQRLRSSEKIEYYGYFEIENIKAGHNTNENRVS